ncbi:hypothetical protein RSP673_019470 (plasmid) [Ralstonia solanacearum P673]|uniref:hypothetical protein n=1 Tax=Ralstonia solanacearum TaxID=305 RepID=UPI00202AC21C|nr:hypothetical protein [Ralstonia solanacearum]MCL9851878.1 hypothetical protein [Ralstonia solanacearum]MCL9856903.1 hypothetical protein [Ralstonia solanacearum]MCL9861640.1 hypothetical protein [Ralstonia solanacearum]MCL9866533.1 hypothetical protein [Ralstonia solanacearum]MCL9871276.1 hypothetical protein [Ralstonia solanacearum]
MSLTGNIAELAAAIAQEVRARITADHPALARAWVSFGTVGDQVVIRSAYNVDSVIRVGTGKYRVVFAAPMPDDAYCWTALARNAGRQSAMKTASARARAEAKTAAFVEVICTTAAGTLTDTSELNLIVFR